MSARLSVSARESKGVNSIRAVILARSSLLHVNLRAMLSAWLADALKNDAFNRGLTLDLHSRGFSSGRPIK